MSFVCDVCCVQPPTSTPLNSATAPAPATSDSDALNPVTFSQLLQLVESLSYVVAGLTAQVQELAASQDYTDRLAYISINGNGIQRDQLFAEGREFDERKKRKESLIVGGIRVNCDDEFLSRFSDV